MTDSLKERFTGFPFELDGLLARCVIQGLLRPELVPNGDGEEVYVTNEWAISCTAGMLAYLGGVYVTLRMEMEAAGEISPNDDSPFDSTIEALTTAFSAVCAIYVVNYGDEGDHGEIEAVDVIDTVSEIDTPATPAEDQP